MEPSTAAAGALEITLSLAPIAANIGLSMRLSPMIVIHIAPIAAKNTTLASDAIR
jgi:hypothetical protein